MMAGYMVKRRKMRTTTAASRASGGSVHDRRAKDLTRLADVAAWEIPEQKHLATREGETITVFRQLRNDPLARLHSHHQIDEAQYHAGRAFQRDWEAAERGARAIDPTKEAVDGGRIPEPLTDSQAKARKRLIEIESALGLIMYRVVYSVLVDGLTMEQLAFHGFNRKGDRAENYYGRLFRDALDVLAVEYNLAGRT